MRLLRPTWFEIDLDAAAENLRAVRRLVGPARRIFAVVKANGYGFGAVELGETFLRSGADALAVADPAEGVRLRKRGVTAPILVYPSALGDAAAEVLAHGLTPTVTDLETAQAYARAASGPCALFVKVDVGLERLGVPAERAVETVRALGALPNLALAGLCAHPHAPAGVDPAYVDWQLARFTGVIDALTAAGVEVPVRLLASSPLVLRFPHTYLNAVDPGRMLYGIGAGGEAAPPVALRPAFAALKSRLIEVKAVGTRERFADRAPIALRPGMRLGVIPAGAGDGLLALNAGRVLVRGRPAPILATPSLEHTRVDLTDVPDARVGDEVVLVGRQGDAEITVAEVARCHGREPLQVALAVGERVARVYLAGGRVASVVAPGG
jgi:alanine racemase